MVAATLEDFEKKCNFIQEIPILNAKITKKEYIEDFINLIRDLNEIMVDQQFREEFLYFWRAKEGEITDKYPVGYLLFDAILAWLGEDFTDANIYLDHAFHLGLIEHNLYLIFSIIINEPSFREVKEISYFMANFASLIQPPSAPIYAERYGKEFEMRFATYKKTLGK